MHENLKSVSSEMMAEERGQEMESQGQLTMEEPLIEFIKLIDQLTLGFLALL